MKIKHTAYVKHPISKEDKKKLNEQGFKVVDLKFKPEEIEKGDKVIDGKPKRTRKPKEVKHDDESTTSPDSDS